MSYVSIHKSQLLDSLENQILYADLACVIIGQKGIGKSFFLQQLHARMSGMVALSQIEADPAMTQAQLEKSVGLQLGLGWQESEESLLDKIASNIDQRVLLTIDDAHLLDQSCLDFLMGLATRQLAAKQTLLYILLAGESGLASKLSHTASLKYDPNICVVFELKPVEEQETKFFIAQFQSIDPGTAEALYEEQKMSYFWQLSKGVPGDIKYQLERWLEQEEVKSKPKSGDVSSSSVKKYLLSAGYVALAILLILALVFQDEINQTIAPTPAKVAAKDSEKLGNVITQQTKSEESLGSESALVKNELPNEETESDVLRADDSETQKPDVSNDIKTTIEDESPEKQQSTETVVGTEKAENKSVLEKSTKQPVKPVKYPVASVETSEREQKKSSDSIGTTDEQKLLQMDDARYTLQWIGVSSLGAAQKFREQHPLKESMLIFRRKSPQGELFLIVSGQYNSRVDADNAKTIYLRRGYSGKPWVKSLKSVKQEISAS